MNTTTEMPTIGQVVAERIARMERILYEKDNAIKELDGRIIELQNQIEEARNVAISDLTNQAAPPTSMYKNIGMSGSNIHR